MNLGLVGFTLPLQLVITFIFTWLAKRKMYFNLTFVFDLAISLCMITWFIKYQEYMNAVNDGLNLQDVPNQN